MNINFKNVSTEIKIYFAVCTFNKKHAISKIIKLNLLSGLNVQHSLKK